MTIAALQDLSADMQRCIDNCLACHATCERTSAHCLRMGGEHASKDHQTTMRDCAQLCATCADFMIRESAIHMHVCGACAVACEHCEEECRRLANGDEMMLACADTCAKCAETCRMMSSAEAPTNTYVI